jgi:hydroxyisourate hydrolase
VLDTRDGIPARNMHITLSEKLGSSFKTLADGETNDDGRVAQGFLPKIEPGHTYVVEFQVQKYFQRERNVKTCFHPRVQIEFRVPDDAAGQHFHVPLLVSPWSYSTYRGS